MGRKGKDCLTSLPPISGDFITVFRGYVMSGLNGLPYRPSYGPGSGYSRYWDFGQFGNNPGLYNTLLQSPSYP